MNNDSNVSTIARYYFSNNNIKRTQRHQVNNLYKMRNSTLILLSIISFYYHPSNNNISLFKPVASFAFTTSSLSSSSYQRKTAISTITNTHNKLFYPMTRRTNNNNVIILNGVERHSKLVVDDSNSNDDIDNNKKIYVDSSETNIIDVELAQHKPLGCTIEESLAIDDDKAVFISRITNDSNADKAGLKIGDVILKVSGVFTPDILEDVSAKVGLSRIKSLISGRPTEEILKLQIIRGTNVKINHEESLFDLCVIPDEDVEKNEINYLNDCLNVINRNEYSDDIEIQGDTTVVSECGDGDMECMLDAMFDVWNDEYEGNKKKDDDDDSDKEEKVKKDERPWASRSSPSGTYVRNPITRKLENIG